VWCPSICQIVVEIIGKLSNILRYLKGTKNKGIMFERQHGDACITGFIDSDYAVYLNKHRSTCDRGLVSWRFMLQSISILSMTEAEYMALMEATK